MSESMTQPSRLRIAAQAFGSQIKGLWPAICALMAALWSPVASHLRPIEAPAGVLLVCVRIAARCIERFVVSVGCLLSGLAFAHAFSLLRVDQERSEMAGLIGGLVIGLSCGLLAVGVRPRILARCVASIVLSLAIGYGVYSLPWACDRAQEVHLTTTRITVFDVMRVK